MTGWRSQWRLVLLNSLTCGLEICVAAGITYVPPLLLEAGVEEQYMTMVLGIGPVLGLLFIPLIGSASDHCNSSYGRRRPFIWLLSLGVLLALFIIPHADVLAANLSWGSTRRNQALQVGLLILGVGLLDFCGQVCFTPLEALLSDLYRERDDCGQAFAMFSFMVSLGGCVGYLLPALDWSGGLLSIYLGGQAECLFSLLILIFVVSVLVTMKVSEEPSFTLEPGPSEPGRCFPRSCCYLFQCKLRALKSGPLMCLLRTCWSMTPAIYRSYCHVPRVMRQLCLAQLCSWMGVMSFMLFYTDFVGEGLYPYGQPGPVSAVRYLNLLLAGHEQAGASLWVQDGLSEQHGVLHHLRSGHLLVQEHPVYMQNSKTKKTHTNGFTITRDSVCLTLDNGPGDLNHKSGISNGHVHYSRDEPEYYPPVHQNGAPLGLESEDFEKRGVGLDFAILDSTFLLSQVFPTLFMGMIVQFTESVTAYIASSAIFGAIGIYFATHIVFDQNDLRS
ncbi:Solute carrier family 45 member 3 [Labeo rohita]|uniref:Solute carrier family 45 member 3 n=1 Tax=Labeo rohita TaxID=84645 RepID=A0ABQ8LD20_LABRO|nr:Solute carrier family 45 member 3 [Labeo rohita]